MTHVNDYHWTPAPPCSHEYIAPAIKDLLSRQGAQSVLDVGCGNGSILRSLQTTVAHRVGCDADAGGIAFARNADPEAYYVHAPIGSSPDLPISPFDAIISTEVIEHLYSPDDLFVFAKRYANPNTLFHVSTPYHGWLKNEALAVSGHWDSHHTPLWTGGHIKFWSVTTLTALAQRNNWKRVGFSGVGRCPWLWKSMILSFRLIMP